MKLIPDFSFSGGELGDSITYIHRRNGDMDIYFVASAEPEARQANLAFRAEGKVPWLFDPASGEVLPLAVYTQYKDRVELPLHLDPYGSAFIVLVPGSHAHAISSVDGPQHVLISMNPEGVIESEFFCSGTYKITFNKGEVRELEIDVPEDFPLEGEWELFFDHPDVDKRRRLLSELVPWNESEDPVIRYYSGTVSYRKEWVFPDGFADEGQKVYLDLGQVEKLARVTLNGQVLPELWKLPFRTEVSDWLREGRNELLVEVTNTWANRMIGDEELPPDLNYPSFHRNLTEIPDWLDGSKPRPTERETFAITKFFYRGEKLQESGLLGPVVLKSSKLVILDP
jgi:hypothetical protein